MNNDLATEVNFNTLLKPQITQEVQKLLQEKLNSLSYEHNTAQMASNELSDLVLKKLTSKNKNFKYIVNCLLMQKAECGLNISGSCFWDNEVDGSVTVKHETDSLIAIVNLFACAL